jgi:hypothetical protein
MKKAIYRLKGVLDKVTNLRGVNFKWKNDQDDTNRIGLVAQEVEKVFPNLFSQTLRMIIRVFVLEN